MIPTSRQADIRGRTETIFITDIVDAEKALFAVGIGIAVPLFSSTGSTDLTIVVIANLLSAFFLGKGQADIHIPIEAEIGALLVGTDQSSLAFSIGIAIAFPFGTRAASRAELIRADRCRAGAGTDTDIGLRRKAYEVSDIGQAFKATGTVGIGPAVSLSIFARAAHHAVVWMAQRDRAFREAYGNILVKSIVWTNISYTQEIAFAFIMGVAVSLSFCAVATNGAVIIASYFFRAVSSTLDPAYIYIFSPTVEFANITPAHQVVAAFFIRIAISQIFIARTAESTVIVMPLGNGTNCISGGHIDRSEADIDTGSESISRTMIVNTNQSAGTFGFSIAVSLFSLTRSAKPAIIDMSCFHGALIARSIQANIRIKAESKLTSDI